MKKMCLTDVSKKRIIVFGCGRWGRRCVKDLAQKKYQIVGCCDNLESKWGTKFMGYPVYSPEEIVQMKDEITIVIATQYFIQIKKQMNELNIDAYIYYSHAVYNIKDENSVLGCNETDELFRFLDSKYICLVGNQKHREDFKYVFDFIKIGQEIDAEKETDLGETGEKEVIYIICEKEILSALDQKKLIYNKDYIYAEDLFCTLDDAYIESSGKIPSLMMSKTFYAQMQEQSICTRPFRNAVINSAYNFHFCCGDWSDPVGNILQDDMEQIWKSSIARIFRLSLINRTYSFCNLKTCVHLKPQAKATGKRILPIPQVEKVPKSLEIGIDKTCNLFCKSCRNCVIVETGERQKKTENAKNAILSSGWLEACDVLLLGGQGEVFFSKIYQELMFFGSEKRHSLDLRTNGTLLNESNFEKLRLKYDKLKIIVSIDAASEKTYNNLRRSSNKESWKMLKHNLEMLATERRNGRLDYFQMNMCVQMDNYMEIPDFVKWAEQLGVDKVYLTPIRNWGTYSAEEFENVRIMDKNKTLRTEVRQVIREMGMVNKFVEFAFEV